MEATAGSSNKTSPHNQFPKRAPLVAASSPRHIPQGRSPGLSWKPRAGGEILGAASAGFAVAGLEAPSQRLRRQAPRPGTTRLTPRTRLPRTSVLLRVFPLVTFSPHLRYNSPRLNNLAIRSNEYLRSKRFLLTTAPIRWYDFLCYLEETSLTLPATPALTLALSITCSLFSLILKLPSFVFNSLQPLFPKHPGGEYLCDTSASSASLRCPSPSLLFDPVDDSCALLYLPLK
jgi:hypothetical protein